MDRDRVKWPVLFPLDRTKGELVDIVKAANKEIQQLESDVAHWKQNFDDERHAYHAMWARVKELEEAIEKHKLKCNWLEFDIELYAVLDKKPDTCE